MRRQPCGNDGLRIVCDIMGICSTHRFRGRMLAVHFTPIYKGLCRGFSFLGAAICTVKFFCRPKKVAYDRSAGSQTDTKGHQSQ
ncbi:hypothetical protein ACN47E_004704 [Coniothyrium glycines]